MNEATFSRQFMQAWAEYEGCLFYHKIADVPMTWIKEGPPKKIPRAVDYMACFDGKFVAIEWKLIKAGRRLPFNQVRPVQFETLKNVSDAGGLGLIMFGYYQDQTSAVYVFTISDFLNLERRYELLGRKSAPLDDLDRFRILRIRVGRRMIWQFDKLEVREMLGLPIHPKEELLI